MYPSSRCRTVLYLVIALLLQPAFGVSAKDYPGLIDNIDSILRAPCLNHGIQSVVIESLDDSKRLYAKDQDTLMIPASCMKLIVSAAALDKLGARYRFVTYLYRTGEVDKRGNLHGDLVLRGTGDPIFSLDDLREFVSELKKSGIKKVSGNIVGDDTLFDNQRLGWGWSWDDEPYYYAAQCSALNLNKNIVTVSVKPGFAERKPAIWQMYPATTYLTVTNAGTTGSSGSENTISIDRARGRNIVRIVGSIPYGNKEKLASERISVEEPALFAASVMKEELIRSGITVTGTSITGKTPDASTLVSRHSSPPLSEILPMLNKPSDNLIAEILLRALAVEATGLGTTDDGLAAEKAFLKAAGLDTEAMRLIDGSGLSRQNSITSANLLLLLKRMYHHPTSDIYINSLPVAGVDGTLKRRMKGTKAEGNVRAKSGYLNGISSLCGYVTTKGGDHLAFVMLMNNHLCRNAEAIDIQDTICTYLADLE